MSRGLSVIVPTLNEAPVIAETLRRARQPGVLEIIVADGGSSDSTRATAEPLADVFLVAERGRARQMNAGAAVAKGEVLLFLHADTVVPPDFALAALHACAEGGAVGGRFDVAIEPATPLVALTAFLMNRRSRLSGIATGDQGIFLRRDVFQRLGGYADIPLMEDIDLSRRLKRAGPIACLSLRLVTSSRRWLNRGPLRTILLMWSLRFLYFAGVSPRRLRRLYDDVR